MSNTSEMTSSSPRISIIGYPQSGKTVLAVGLYASSVGANVEAITGGDILQSYRKSLESGSWLGSTDEKRLEDIRLRINRGSKSSEITFVEYRGERISKTINLDKYLIDVVQKPDGAMILINPRRELLNQACPSAESDAERVEMIDRFKKVIRYLADETECQYVALVITASDLLGKLNNVGLEKFNNCRDELISCLQNNDRFRNRLFSKHWRVFQVSVTGKLENLDEPRLASGRKNSARKPFVWLLDRVETSASWRRVLGKLKTFFITAGALGLVGAISIGSWCYWFDRETEREIGKLVAANGMALEKAVKDGKLSDINKSCGALEKGLKNFEGKRPFFNQNRERLAALAGDVVRRIEGGRVAWYPGEIERFEKEITKIDAEKGLTVEDYGNQLDQLRDFDKKVKSFKVITAEFTNHVPVVLGKWQDSRARIVAALEAACCKGCQFKIRSEAASIRESLEGKDNQDKMVEVKPFLEARKSITEEYAKVDLGPAAKQQLAGLMQDTVTTWSNLIVQIDGHNADVLKLRFATCETNAPLKASEQMCEEWRHEFESWRPASAEGLDLQKRLLADFDQKKGVWRKTYELRRYEEGFRSLLSRLEKSGQNLDDGDELKAVLVECRKYEKYGKDEASLPLVDFSLRKSTWEKVMAGRTALLDELLQSTINRIKPDGDEAPMVSEDDSKFLSAVLKDESSMAKDEYARWMNELNRKVEDVRKVWETKQNDECDKFAAEIEGGLDAYVVLKKFANFYEASCISVGV